MDKVEMKEFFVNLQGNINLYAWSLFVFRIDKRKKNPYEFYKFHFSDDEYISNYVKNLVECCNIFQVETIDEIQDYNGENTKNSCDKLELNSELISDAWQNFELAIANRSDEKIKDKIAGYILMGNPVGEIIENILPVSFIKFSNPIVKFNNKKHEIYYKVNATNSLDQFNDDLYKLYLITDALVINRTLYTFNQNFEPVFDLVKTIDKIKERKINEIIAEDVCIISNPEEFKKYAKRYSSPKTFLNLNEEKIDLMKIEKERKEIAHNLGLSTDESNLVVIKDQKDANNLIQYLCNRIVEEKRTNNILTVNNAKIKNMNE